jgi:tRNA G37 N-methylase Trm5
MQGYFSDKIFFKNDKKLMALVKKWYKKGGPYATLYGFFDAGNPKNDADLCFKCDLRAIFLNPKIRNEKYRLPWKL